MATIPASPSPDSQSDQFAPRSSFMELVKYDRQASAMDIHFKSGTVHRYLFCFPATFQTFKESPTHDAYYARAIKGKLMSVKIKSHNIGREVSHALKAQRQRRTLDAGVKRIYGTVSRAGL